jgi:nucleoside-diphosphate-sugar epimerase
MDDHTTNGSATGKDIIGPEDLILITGAAGFIGTHVLSRLLERGFRNFRCFLRPSGNSTKIEQAAGAYKNGARVELFKGNLLSAKDCAAAAKGAKVVYHLAAGRGEKLVADAFMNSVVTTRNLMDACGADGGTRRFVSISSFSVYSNRDKPAGRLLDESCPMENQPHLRGDAYTFAKVRQDELVAELAAKWKMPYVIVRPGVVYGPGNEAVLGRVGIGTFGIFLHLGGGNHIPLTYVDNCAEAIVLAGLRPGVEGEVFNVVDDQPPSSREFLSLYKKNVKAFKSIYLPPLFSYGLCFLWEKYSDWSQGQLPNTYGRRAWHAYWKKTRYTNSKLKNRLGWKPVVSRADAFSRFFESCRKKVSHA